MPIDRKIVLENLKDIDQELYQVCNLFEKVRDYLKNNDEVSYRFQMYIYSLEAMFQLEQEGIIEILNDYKRKEIYLIRKVIV